MNLNDFIEELRPLVNTDCGTTTTAGVAQIAQSMHQKYLDLGWHAEIVDLGSAVGPGVFATNKPGACQYDVLLVGHMDTVFPEGTDVKVRREGTKLFAPGLPPAMVAVYDEAWRALANALGAYATVFALTTGNFNVLPIRIAAMVSGDISLDPNMASALAVILVGLMTLVTLVHQWLLKRSYHVAR